MHKSKMEKKMLGMDRYMYFGGIGNPLVFSEKPQDYMKSFEKELLGFRQGGNYLRKNFQGLDVGELLGFRLLKLK